MKKLVLTATAFAISVSFIACGGKSEKKADVQLSTEMQDFMVNFNGRAASVAIALETFGKPGLESHDMEMYDLDKPKVLEANGNCYLMQFTSGLTKRKYNVCWEAGKISSIEDKGME